MDIGTYETDELLNQYLLFHYGDRDQQMPWAFGPVDSLDFPVRCVQQGFAPDKIQNRQRALDVGCAVGRASFELARHFSEVIGIDYSHAFIAAANQLLQAGSCHYAIRETGSIVRDAIASSPLVPKGHLVFEQGDAQRLRADLGAFDFVLAANLLCRLARPASFLALLPDLVRPAGQLVITTPNTWLESFTAKDYWLGATPDTGMPLEALQANLESSFYLDEVWDMPFIIREHQRKYQWSVAQASRWIRKG